MENLIIIKDGYLKVEGFNKINRKLVFCLYDDNIVIKELKKDTNINFMHYIVEKTKDNTIEDKILTQILKDRNYGNQLEFILIKDLYYLDK